MRVASSKERAVGGSLSRPRAAAAVGLFEILSFSVTVMAQAGRHTRPRAFLSLRTFHLFFSQSAIFFFFWPTQGTDRHIGMIIARQAWDSRR